MIVPHVRFSNLMMMRSSPGFGANGLAGQVWVTRSSSFFMLFRHDQNGLGAAALALHTHLWILASRRLTSTIRQGLRANPTAAGGTFASAGMALGRDSASCRA
jgi:hypothetical protein